MGSDRPTWRQWRIICSWFADFLDFDILLYEENVWVATAEIAHMDVKMLVGFCASGCPKQSTELTLDSLVAFPKISTAVSCLIFGVLAHITSPDSAHTWPNSARRSVALRPLALCLAMALFDGGDRSSVVGVSAPLPRLF
jgi:hypothetical protein